MKKLYYLCILFVFPISVISQASFSEFNFSYGKYEVGFKNVTLADSSRNYQQSMLWTRSTVARPISISLWYPTKKSEESNPMTMLDYMRIYVKEKEWEYLPNEEILGWLNYPKTPKNQQSIQEQTKAFKEAPFTDGKFPLILYASSYEASSVENFALAEYLASHGYVVIAAPSLGSENQWIGKNLKGGVQAQAKDLKFLLDYASQLSIVDQDQIATAGFSLGGLSHVLFQMNHPSVKAILSLDGTIRYNYKLLKEMPDVAIEKVNVPFLHMAQKVIPEEIVKKDKIDPKLNTEFTFYDELMYSDAYKLRFHDLTHLNFSSLDIVFRNRDPRQDKSDEKILQSYRLVLEYSLQFLNAYLKNDPKALAFLQSKEYSELISKEFKTAERKPFNFQDFHDLIKEQEYQNIESISADIKQRYPNFEIKEWQLNQVGLQLIFNPETAEAGIAIYKYALSLFPKSANLYDSLATGYYYLNRKDEAKVNFQKSLELYPQNQNAIDKLKLLAKN